MTVSIVKFAYGPSLNYPHNRLTDIYVYIDIYVYVMIETNLSDSSCRFWIVAGRNRRALHPQIVCCRGTEQDDDLSTSGVYYWFLLGRVESFSGLILGV